MPPDSMLFADRMMVASELLSSMRSPSTRVKTRRTTGYMTRASLASANVEIGARFRACGAAILDQEMDAIFRNLLDDIASTPTLERHRATAANRIVLLCRNLADQIRQYEHLRGLAASPMSQKSSATTTSSSDAPPENRAARKIPDLHAAHPAIRPNHIPRQPNPRPARRASHAPQSVTRSAILRLCYETVSNAAPLRNLKRSCRTKWQATPRSRWISPSKVS